MPYFTITGQLRQNFTITILAETEGEALDELYEAERLDAIIPDAVSNTNIDVSSICLNDTGDPHEQSESNKV